MGGSLGSKPGGALMIANRIKIVVAVAAAAASIWSTAGRGFHCAPWPASLQIPFYGSYTETDPAIIAQQGVERFKKEGR